MDLCESSGFRLKEMDRHFWELARADFLQHLLRAWLGKKEGVLLDVGCGDGFLLERFAIQLWQGRFHAVDPAFHADRMAELEARFPGRVTATRELPVGELSQVSVVMLFDVLEHVEDDCALLRRLAAGVSPGTLFLITVPSGRRLFGPLDRRLRHFRRYDRRELNILVEKAGLELLECRSFFCSLYFVRCLELLLNRPDDGRGVGGGAISPRFLNVFLRRILAAEAVVERKVTGALPLPGLSLEVVCRSV